MKRFIGILEFFDFDWVAKQMKIVIVHLTEWIMLRIDCLKLCLHRDTLTRLC
jgi:hypothetical protein